MMSEGNNRFSKHPPTSEKSVYSSLEERKVEVRCVFHDVVLYHSDGEDGRDRVRYKICLYV